MLFVSFISTRRLLRRRILFLIAGFGLISISCFGQSIFFAVPSTPYDRQMARIYPTLNCTAPQWPGPLPISLPVNQWMMQLRAMPYHFSKHWLTPSEVGLAQATDCKGKAVALYAQMRQSGARNVRVIIGRRHIFDSATHAWLEWETTAGSYVLDPTFNDTPIKTSQLDPATYVPLYAFDDAHKYRAANAGFVATGTTAVPALGNRFYIPTTKNYAPHHLRHSSSRARHSHVVLNPQPALNVPPQWPTSQW